MLEKLPLLNQPLLISFTKVKFNDILKSKIGNPKSKSVISLVGKGILFDAGGLNIKTSLLEEMYLDKCLSYIYLKFIFAKGGAVNVLSAFNTITEMKLPVE